MARVRPRKFVHVVYRTHRFNEMMNWYSTVFDAHVQHFNPGITFLTYDDEHHRIALVNLSLMKPSDNKDKVNGLVGIDHVAYTYDSLTALFQNYEQLKALGIKPYWAIHHGITISLYYADPDGNQMEFQADVYQTNEEANAFLAGPGFAENPIGVEFDADEMLAKLKAGVPESEFLIRKIHQPTPPIRGAMDRAP